MKTANVAPTPELDLVEIEKNHADPTRFDQPQVISQITVGIRQVDQERLHRLLWLLRRIVFLILGFLWFVLHIGLTRTPSSVTILSIHGLPWRLGCRLWEAGSRNCCNRITRIERPSFDIPRPLKPPSQDGG